MRNQRIGSAIACIAFIFLVFYMLQLENYVPAHIAALDLELENRVKTAGLLLGPPAPKFRDNLRPDRKYITGWNAGGLTNGFISHVNLIYISLLAQRIPVLPPFTPIHIGTEPGVIKVSQVFDLNRLSEAIHSPVLEWSQIKDLSARVKEDLSCWSVQDTLAGQHHYSPNVEDELHLNFSYTRVPDGARLTYRPGEYWANHMNLASLSFPAARKEALEEAADQPSDLQGPGPDEHMMCFDLLYFTASSVPFEWQQEWAPAWRLVGTHLKWNTTLENVSKQLVAKAFGLLPMEVLPTFVSVHIRRSDFKHNCEEDVACLPSLDAYERRIKQVQQELQATRNKHAAHVLVTSDENDPKWWQTVADRGWARIDHEKERTAKIHGDWFLPVIDAIAHSLAMGFVGTEHSTMSLVAAKRVVEWNGGVARMVIWDPFDHQRAIEAP